MFVSRVQLLCLVTLLTFDPRVCFPLTSPYHPHKDIGTIWQVTDFHLDLNYSIYGDRSQMCHRHAAPRRRSHRDHDDEDVLSNYGDYACDPPWALVTSAISAMKSIDASPDFILWTGDSIPHIKDSDDNIQKVYQVIGNITQHLRSTFPNTTIYPTVGNHDSYPANQMPATTPGSDFYAQLLNRSHWSELLKPKDQAQFTTAGYYTTLISKGFRLVSLNTNLYYSLNALTVNMTDPGGQLQWLQDQLELASHNNEKVLLMAHVPPGIFERRPFLQWFQADFNDRLVNILTNYTDTVNMQIFGHEHTDTFRLIYKDGVAASVMFMAPAVTPMNSTLPGVGPNNPGIRLYYYNRTTNHLLNYHQYYLNLSSVQPRVNRADWQLEYRALEDFPLDAFSAQGFQQLASEFSLDPTSPFRRYLRYNSVSVGLNGPEPVPSQKTLAAQVCAIRQPTMRGYARCAKDLSGGELDAENYSDDPFVVRPLPRQQHASLGGDPSFSPTTGEDVVSTPPQPSSSSSDDKPSYGVPGVTLTVHGPGNIHAYFIVVVFAMSACLGVVLLAVMLLRKRYTSTAAFLSFRYRPLNEKT